MTQQLQELHDRVPNPPAEDTPDGDREEDAVVVKVVGDPPSFAFEPRDHLDLAAAHGWIDVERGREGVGLALRLPRRRCGPARDRPLPLGARADRAEAPHTDAAAGAGARRGDVRHGLLSVRQGRLLRGARGRPLSHRHIRGAARRVSRRRGARRAAASLRRVLDVLSARGGGGGEGHPRDVPRAPVRQGRDVRLLRAGRIARRARAAARDRGGARAGARPARIAS